MSSAWLANTDPTRAWAHRPWPEFAATTTDIAILPIHGLADHGLGLPLDAEEVLASELLHRALRAVDGPWRVLPPLRHGLAPYPATFFGLDPETAGETLLEIADSVRAAGVQRLVFLNTSPWNEELVDAMSRDARARCGLDTFVINLAGIGLDFHPSAPERAAVQAVTAHLLGRPPAAASLPADIADADFRPGRYRQPPPLTFTPGLDASALLDQATLRLARLLNEVLVRPAPGQSRASRPTPSAPRLENAPAVAAGTRWPRYRDRYLGAFTRDELAERTGRADALVILPTGAIEQHGHHLPVGVDAILGQAWLAHALPLVPADVPVYVAPPITYGKSNEHAGFPGTISISARTLRRQVRASVAQLQALGFRRIALLNTHGGNSPVLVYTIRELQADPELQIGMLSGHYRPEQDAQEAAYGFHAGEWETSLLLACAPELVRMERATCEYPARIGDPGELRPENAPAVFSWLTKDVSVSGVMGDATRATVEKGVRWMTEAALALAQRIEQLQRRPRA